MKLTDCCCFKGHKMRHNDMNHTFLHLLCSCEHMTQKPETPLQHVSHQLYQKQTRAPSEGRRTITSPTRWGVGPFLCFKFANILTPFLRGADDRHVTADTKKRRGHGLGVDLCVAPVSGCRVNWGKRCTRVAHVCYWCGVRYPTVLLSIHKGALGGQLWRRRQEARSCS